MVKESKMKNILKVIIHQWVQFSSNTSLHGWKYTALPQISKFERYLWFIICFASISASVFLLASAWSKFQSNPNIIVTESTQHSIYKFIFPAVTFCSFNKISKSAAYNMARKLSASGSNVEATAHSLRLLFDLVNIDEHTVPQKEYENLHQLLKNNRKTEEEVFKNISPSCEVLIKKCMWKGEDTQCEIMFEQIKTSSGYCCSFNYFALKYNAIPDSGRVPNRASKSPRQTSSCGYQTGLEVLLYNDPGNYFATHVPSVGFRVLIHDPYEYPDWSFLNTMVEMNTNNFIGINPQVISATDNIRAKSISARKCLFRREKQLENFAQYTFHNCLVECKMELTLELCGCVPFYIHNKKGTYASANVCNLKDIQCLTKNEHFLYNETYMQQRSKDKGGKCHCLPNCDSTIYTPEASKGILDATYCTNQFRIYSDTNLDNHTIVRIFFNDLLGTRHRRDVLYTWHTLMGYYGGILGLFTGFSFISVVEIIYFAVVRLLDDLKNRKTENQPQENVVAQLGARQLLRPI